MKFWGNGHFNCNFCLAWAALSGPVIRNSQIFQASYYKNKFFIWFASLISGISKYHFPDRSDQGNLNAIKYILCNRIVAELQPYRYNSIARETISLKAEHKSSPEKLQQFGGKIVTHVGSLGGKFFLFLSLYPSSIPLPKITLLFQQEPNFSL